MEFAKPNKYSLRRPRQWLSVINNSNVLIISLLSFWKSLANFSKMIILQPPPKCWDYSWMPPHQILEVLNMLCMERTTLMSVKCKTISAHKRDGWHCGHLTSRVKRVLQGSVCLKSLADCHPYYWSDIGIQNYSQRHWCIRRIKKVVFLIYSEQQENRAHLYQLWWAIFLGRQDNQSKVWYSWKQSKCNESCRITVHAWHKALGNRDSHLACLNLAGVGLTTLLRDLQFPLTALLCSVWRQNSSNEHYIHVSEQACMYLRC